MVGDASHVDAAEAGYEVWWLDITFECDDVQSSSWPPRHEVALLIFVKVCVARDLWMWGTLAEMAMMTMMVVVSVIGGWWLGNDDYPGGEG